MSEHTPNPDPSQRLMPAPSPDAPETGGSGEENVGTQATGAPINDLSQAGYQPEGVPADRLVGLIGATLVCITAVVLSLYFIFYAPFKDHRQQVAENVSPNVEQSELRAQAVEALSSYGVTADSNYRIPVVEAMKKLAVRDSGVALGRDVAETRSFFNAGSIQLLPASAVASGEQEAAGEGDVSSFLEVSEQEHVVDPARGED